MAYEIIIQPKPKKTLCSDKILPAYWGELSFYTS